MKQTCSILLLLAMLAACNAPVSKNEKQAASGDSVHNNKLIIYQMLTRLFGNKNTTNKYYGSEEENGVGKFGDINDKALDSLKTLGITHVWYTGIIEHPSMQDYSSAGIAVDDPDVVKGRAGSPYAIKDYYDVDPDLATDVKNRMQEFEALVIRTHDHGLKVIIDFVPNHVARTYHSNAKPSNVADFGANDDVTKTFSAQNDFYYITGKSFVVPKGVNAGGSDFKSPLKDNKFAETPAKATGNNVFSEAPSIDDWYETIKLNYGVDYKNGETKHLSPQPSVWLKMRDILVFWANKHVDGFRCDVAEMVPVEFWEWVIPQVKKVNPQIVFIAEAYNPKVFQQYLTQGKFDYLYDKVGLYDAVKRLIKNDSLANTNDIVNLSNADSAISSNLLRFLENHDEERIASKGFAQKGENGIPGMIVSATLSGGPVMIYFGQEMGEHGDGKEGFGGEDNRTTLFDYWGVPAHQAWMNNGAFDGKSLSKEQKKLRAFYATLLNYAKNSDAIKYGKLSMLPEEGFDKKSVAYVRNIGDQIVLVVVNFNRDKTINLYMQMPANLFDKKSDRRVVLKEIFTRQSIEINDLSKGIPVQVSPMNGVIFEVE
ncbi:alpha-amylase family protein [Pinibacter soli]|uniref:Alpha-amylase family protein n=1 Tax=Pinibacter soli TaxID=3044211 RepID=A0ABT6RCD1_9BACT|nr:alpha-amylase family protein [Pinibacter soli]MDI3319532.1 alpha-amylase family protein [Pinibacter soli]